MVSENDLTRKRQLLDEVYREHSAAVYRFALRLCQDQNDAEDVTMEAFVNLYRTMHRMREPGAVKTWLYRAVLNQWKKRLRRRKTDTLDPEIVDVFGLSATDRLALWEVMNSLPEKLRIAVWLVKGEGLTHKETGEVLGVPTGTVQDRVFRAMKVLRSELDPACEQAGKLSPKQSEVRA